MAKNQAVTTQAPPAAPAAGPTRSTGLVAKFAARFSVEPDRMLATLKATAFKTGKNDPDVTNEQMMALLVVSDQYGLNPFTKEIYAFPDEKKGGITPVISIDGWVRIINGHPALKSVTFRLPGQRWPTKDDPNQGEEDIAAGEIPPWMECKIERSDRELPVIVREYFDEVKRNTGPWGSHPRRMLRHKVLIQCGRLAFGFGGVYDPDEAERIREAMVIDVTPPRQKPTTEPPKALPQKTDAPATAEQLEEIRKLVDSTGIPEGAILDHFDFGVLEDVRFDQVADVIAWLNRTAP